jgi:hypothetical protein
MQNQVCQKSTHPGKDEATNRKTILLCVYMGRIFNHLIPKLENKKIKVEVLEIVQIQNNENHLSKLYLLTLRKGL